MIGLVAWAMLQLPFRTAEAGEVFLGQVDAAVAGIFREVAQYIRELEGDAGGLGKRLGPWVAAAPNADADEADHGGNLVAIGVEFGEGGEAAVSQVGLHA